MKLWLASTDSVRVHHLFGYGVFAGVLTNGCRLLHWLRGQRVALRLATAVATPADMLLATALEVPWVAPSGSALEKLGGAWEKLTAMSSGAY